MLDLSVNLLMKAGLKFRVDKCVAAFCGINLSSPMSLKLYDADLQWCKEICYLSAMFLF